MPSVPTHEAPSRVGESCRPAPPQHRDAAMCNADQSVCLKLAFSEFPVQDAHGLRRWACQVCFHGTGAAPGVCRTQAGRGYSAAIPTSETTRVSRCLLAMEVGLWILLAAPPAARQQRGAAFWLPGFAWQRESALGQILPA